MTRPELRDLYQQLTTSKFGFMARGQHKLDAVYDAVKEHHPTLCDDGYLCAQNCSSGHNQPEWRHTARKALARLKSSTREVSRTGPGIWDFS
jgi:hypothetical protein